MPAFPFKRISQSRPRTCLTCGSLTLCSPIASMSSAIRTNLARISTGRAASSASTVSFQGFDRPGHDGLYQIWYRDSCGAILATGVRSRRAMRTAFAIGIAVMSLVGSGRGQATDGIIRAWSSTNGPYGQLWHLSIKRDNSATVSSSSDLGAKSIERHFKISTAQRQAIMRATEEAQFFELTEPLGPGSVPIHGPDNTLELEVPGRVHKVFLNDPASAAGPQVQRFHRVWRAVVETSPIKPPL